jgi:thiol-disulfide isomerase/thioredoxin
LVKLHPHSLTIGQAPDRGIAIVLWAALALTVLMPGPARGDTPALELSEVRDGPEATFRLTDLGGQARGLDLHRGEVVVVNFWATWCAPCRAEMASFERVHAEWRRQGIQLLAVNAGDPEESVRRYIANAAVSFPILLDRGATTTRAWQVPGLPATYIVGPDGRIEAAAIGIRDWDHPEMTAGLARRINKRN